MILENCGEFETVTDYKICPFHKKHPGQSYSGCTCVSVYSRRKK